MSQISINEILLFGGEDRVNFNEIDKSFYLNIDDLSIKEGPKLPEKILPETPGYTLDSHAHFYFLGNIGGIFRYNKREKTWSKTTISSNL